MKFSGRLPWIIIHLLISVIPINLYVIGNWFGTGIQWVFFRYQNTAIGTNFIPLNQDLFYILDGLIQGRSALSILFWIVGALLFIFSIIIILLFRETGVHPFKKPGIFLFSSGICFFGSCFFQYGITLHGDAGFSIPIGIPLIFLVGGVDILYKFPVDTESIVPPLVSSVRWIEQSDIILFLKKNARLFIFFFLFAIMIIVFLIRSCPYFLSVSSGQFLPYDPDVWYNLRQVEVLVHQFPQYNWFDPMTSFPSGKVIAWGPLFPWIVSAICILGGASTRPEIIGTASWVPVFIAVMMVPMIYLLGTFIHTRITGIISVAIFSIISLRYYYYTSYGIIDHHCAEVLFSTLFCLLYCYTLIYSFNHPVSFKDKGTILIPFILSIGSGIVFSLGLLVMPTMILFGLIVAIFTVFQMIRNFIRDRSNENILLMNMVIFSIVIVLLFFFGIKHEGFALSLYSIGQPVAYLLLIICTIVLYGMAMIFKENKKRFFYALILIIALSVVIVSQLFETMIFEAISLFFGQISGSASIAEFQPWDLATAWYTYNYSLLLVVGGFALLFYSCFRKNMPVLLFMLIWSIITIISTIQHQRYEYYLAVNGAILSGFFVVLGLSYTCRVISEFDSSSVITQDLSAGLKLKGVFSKQIPEKDHTISVGSYNKKQLKMIGAIIAMGIIILLLGLFFITSFQHASEYSERIDRAILPSEWQESLGWLSSHTPDTGVDYFGQYPISSWHYPPEAYGIMSGWEYGHWITFFSKRIPNTNPFQDNLVGPESSAAFFLSPSEDEANRILSAMGSRYVITSSAMADEKFDSLLVKWDDPSRNLSYYIRKFPEPINSGSGLSLKYYFNQSYFDTMISRLQNGDGSSQYPQNGTIISFKNNKVDNHGNQVISTMESEIYDKISQYDITDEEGLLILSNNISSPINPVPALRHYRLIYESEGNISNSGFVQIGSSFPKKSVKIFEYVKGAHIQGEGIVEIPIVTNTGRSFIYRQESINGEFIVPYPSKDGFFEVKANGQYHLEGTNLTIDVSEEDVEKGNQILMNQSARL